MTMTASESLITIESGCKVGWEIHRDETAAREAGQRAEQDAIRKAYLGFDFGYCVPGEVRHIDRYVSRHVNTDGSRDEYEDVWVVTTP